MNSAVPTLLAARRRRVTATLVVLAGIALLTSRAVAFWPTNLYAEGGSPLSATHERITKLAIRAFVADRFGVTKNTRSQRDAIREIQIANVAVDDDQFYAAPHFDGERLPEGQDRLLTLFDEIVSDPTDPQVRQYLGSALHSLQDFYSHTNWIELGNRSPNYDLVSSAHRLTRPQALETTCFPDPGTLTTLLLTSGYYGGEDVKPSISGKCIHGGPFDLLGVPFELPGKGINKDSYSVAFSPHASLHEVAATVAIDATKDFLRRIADRVTDKQMRSLLGVGAEMAFVINVAPGHSISDIPGDPANAKFLEAWKDATLSMVAEYGATFPHVKAPVPGHAEPQVAAAASDTPPSRFLLTSFGYTAWDPITVTSTDDPDVLKARVHAIPLSGYGDCVTGDALRASFRTLAAMNQGGELFLFTDTRTGSPETADAIIALARSKQVRVFPVLTRGNGTPRTGYVDCFSWGLSPGSSGVDEYQRVARETGGQSFELDVNEMGLMAGLSAYAANADDVQLLSIDDTLVKNAPRSYSIPIEATITRVTVALDAAAVTKLIRPNGAEVHAGDSGVTLLTFGQGTTVVVETPETGTWTVQVAGEGVFALQVSALSTFALESFRFVRFGGRPGHGGIFGVADPTSGAAAMAHAVLTDDVSSTQFELRTKAGTVLASLPLARGTGVAANEYLGSVTVPSAPFRVWLKGIDASGHAFQRVLPKVITPGTVSVAAVPGESGGLIAGVTTGFTFLVTNHGVDAEFAMAVTDERGFQPVVVSLAGVTLRAGESGQVRVTVTTPADAAVGIYDTLALTLHVAGASAPAAVATLVAGPVAASTSTSPVVTAIRPSTGSPGSTLSATIYGLHLDGASAVTFDGTGVTGSIAYSYPGFLGVTISVDAGAALGLRTFTVTTPAGTFPAPSGFTVAVASAQALSWKRRSYFADPRYKNGVETAAVSLIGGKIYTSHGYRIQNVTTALSIYDIVTNTWSHGGPAAPDAATPRAGTSGGTALGRHYAIGGYDSTGTKAAVEEFDPSTNTWRSRASMPAPRTGVGTASLNDKIYVVGGYIYGARASLAVNEVYDPTTDTWVTLRSMPAPAAEPAVVAYGGKVYLFGGYDYASGRAIGIVQMFDPGSDSWAIGTPMPTPRQGAAAGIINGQIAVIGGTGGYGDETELYDPASNTWTIGPRMLDRTSSVSQGVAFANNQVFAISAPSQGICLQAQRADAREVASEEVRAGCAYFPYSMIEVLDSSADLSPQIASISPSSGVPGTTVQATITGLNLAGATSLVFDAGGVTAVPGSGTATSLPVVITIPSTASDATSFYSVNTSAGTSSFAAFPIYSAAPEFTFQPTSQAAAIGETVAFIASAARAMDLRWQVLAPGASSWIDLTDTPPYSGVTNEYFYISNVSTALSGSQYRARATNLLGSATSNAATLTIKSVFTDDPLTPGVTTIKAVHITELRALINGLRARYSLGSYSYTNATITAGVSAVQARDLTEMRQALLEVYIAAARTPPTYATTPATSGTILAVALVELRAAVLAIR